jgi:dTDP-4-amino-4,6-dideoxygalactose transaminase
LTSEIPFIKPWFPPADALADDYERICASNWFTNFGPLEREFAVSLEQFVGQETHVATVSNATLGLVLAVSALLGRGNGSEYVVMPSFTFAAGAQALIWCGYKPYFVDISPATLQMDLEAARGALESDVSVRGILLCNAFGVGTPDIAGWEKLAQENTLPLVIDSAAGFGSMYDDGKPLGARGDCEVFSFHATKPFAIGEGGAVASRDPQLIERIVSLQNFGFQGRDSAALGLNAKLQEISAAIGLRQLGDFADRVAGRQASFARYRRELSGILDFQRQAELSSLCFAAATADSPDQRDFLSHGLRAAGIEVREYYNPPLHTHSYFREHPDLWRAGSLRATDDVCARILSLPIHDHMNPSDLSAVTHTLKELAHGRATL